MMNRQTWRDSRSGVTIIELLVAILSATVLALTCGVILEYCFRTLRSNGDVIALQRMAFLLGIRIEREQKVKCYLPGGSVGIELSSFESVENHGKRLRSEARR